MNELRTDKVTLASKKMSKTQIGPRKDRGTTQVYERVFQISSQLQAETSIFTDEGSCLVLIMHETEGEGERHAAAGNTSHQGASAPTSKSKTHCLCSAGLPHLTHVICTDSRNLGSVCKQIHTAY